MRAFVTGASGFIGSHLVATLVREGWAVRALVHRTEIPESPGVQVVHGDVLDFGLLRESLKGTDVLFHLAAALGASRIGRNEFFRINAAGTENVLRAARETGVRKIIHFSSAGVLGAVKKNDIAGEDYPLNPQNVYDRTKLEGERIALRLAQECLDIVIVRPGWAYGPGDRRTFKLIKSINDGRFFLVAKGRGRQTPVYIRGSRRRDHFVRGYGKAGRGLPPGRPGDPRSRENGRGDRGRVRREDSAPFSTASPRQARSFHPGETFWRGQKRSALLEVQAQFLYPPQGARDPQSPGRARVFPASGF